MMPVVSADLSIRLVPDALWELVGPLLPSSEPRPQGGGTTPCDERAVFTAVVYVLTTGCAWRHLPPTFGTSPATAHRRFTIWTEAGLWRRLHRAELDELGARGKVDWTSAIVDAASVRAKRGITDRLEPGRSRQEGQQAARTVRRPRRPAHRRRVRREHARQSRPQAAHPQHPRHPAPPGSRRSRPVKLPVDKAYCSAEHPAWLRERGLVPRIGRPAIESGERLGRHRWKIERSIAWLFGYRRLTIRYERKGSHFLAFLGLAAALTCCKKLAKLVT